MNFKMIAVALTATVLSAVSAQASQVVCSGRYMGFVNFTVRANLNSSNTAVRGDITVEAKGGGVNQSGRLSPTSSSIRAGNHIRFSGENADGHGNVDARFEASNGTYPGTLQARGSGRDVQVNVVCNLNLNKLQEPDLVTDPSSDNFFRPRP